MKSWPEELRMLTAELIDFRDRRDWGQFHKVKNLAPALAVEVSELLELTQWKTTEELIDALNWPTKFRSDFEKEIADVFIYLLLICAETGIDPINAAYKKLAENELKYPIEQSRGNAIKRALP